MQDHQFADGMQTVSCAVCGESIPRDHTVMRSEIGRICWFCSSDLDEAFEGSWGDDAWDEDDCWDL